MIIKDMFLKNIERDIRGVIKADQTSDEEVKQELEEYVVTQELHKHFSKFYENYLKSVDGKTDKIGVWISGFFGSGKSHFLKILSYLLSDQKIDGKHAVDYFEGKINDPLLYADMQRVANVPTETILFNIDSKSPLGNKSKDDAILRVLLRVFNEHRGYYGNNPVVAELEKYLDKEGNLEKFKEEFEKVANEPWEERRNTFDFDTHFVKEALLNSTEMTEEAIDNWLSIGTSNIEVSIEKFAEEVKEYIDSKEPNFHLVFLIDEIGQYIGDRRDLMLNLQTVAENLGAVCQGQAWIMVTSQESIDSVVKVKGDDFSRIQGRFDTRLSLSSVSVDEVIQKRVLEKNEVASDKLQAMFPEKDAILRNLISFRDATANLTGYKDAKEFADVYPFIPYQFTLLQKVFEQIRKHSASEKHISEGERSMLSAYREAGIRFMNEEEGTLIPFYSFYDTIQEFLQPVVYRVIEGAAQNPALADDPFNNELLKVLFMIKYVKEIPANIDNIATLMITDIDEDKLKLKEKIKSSLKKLINETLINQHGEEYIFLTDDEQDINREIKNLVLEEDKVKRNLAEYIFEDLYDVKKYNYSRIYDFTFNRKMDEKNYGNQTSSIGINILSPLSVDYDKSEQELMMMSMDSKDIIVRLSGDDSYVEEIEEALRIEEYNARQRFSELPENIQNILNSKRAEMRERRNRAKDLLEDALKKSTIYMNGNQIDVSGSTVREKLNSAFKLLVENVYTQLNKIKEFTEHESELKAFLTSYTEQTTLDDSMFENPNEQAKQLVDEYIRLQEEVGKQVRVKPLYDRFTDVPYGWKELDIAKIIAELLREQRIRIRYHAEYLEPMEDANTLMTVFTKSSEADKAIITVRQKVDERILRTVRRSVRDVFEVSNLPDDEDGLIQEIRNLIDQNIREIEKYKGMYQGRKYPGLSLLDKGLDYFDQFDKSLDNVTFFKRYLEMEDDLAQWFDDVYYVKSFFNSNQQSLFDQGLTAIEKYEDTNIYVDTAEVEKAMDELRAIVEDPIPYGKIKDIPELVKVLDEEIQTVLSFKKVEAKEKVQSDYDEVSLHADQYGVSNETKNRVIQEYENFLADIETYEDIYKVDAAISRSRTFKERMLSKINDEIKAWYRKKEEEQAQIKDQDTSNVVVATKPEKQKQAVKIAQLISVQRLVTEEDVDKYVNTLSNKLKDIIKQNKEIEIID